MSVSKVRPQVWPSLWQVWQLNHWLMRAAGVVEQRLALPRRRRLRGTAQRDRAHHLAGLDVHDLHGVEQVVGDGDLVAAEGRDRQRPAAQLDAAQLVLADLQAHVEEVARLAGVPGDVRGFEQQQFVGAGGADRQRVAAEGQAVRIADRQAAPVQGDLPEVRRSASGFTASRVSRLSMTQPSSMWPFDTGKVRRTTCEQTRLAPSGVKARPRRLKASPTSPPRAACASSCPRAAPGPSACWRRPGNGRRRTGPAAAARAAPASAASPSSAFAVDRHHLVGARDGDVQRPVRGEDQAARQRPTATSPAGFRESSPMSSSVTVPDQRLLTAARLPSGVTATADGRRPQRCSASTLPAARSTSDTESAVWLAVRARRRSRQDGQVAGAAVRLGAFAAIVHHRDTESTKKRAEQHGADGCWQCVPHRRASLQFARPTLCSLCCFVVNYFFSASVTTSSRFGSLPTGMRAMTSFVAVSTAATALVPRAET